MIRSQFIKILLYDYHNNFICFSDIEFLNYKSHQRYTVFYGMYTIIPQIIIMFFFLFKEYPSKIIQHSPFSL